MKIEKRFLILIASIVWIIAGCNIMRIGITASNGNWVLPKLFLIASVYLFFHHIVFRRIVKKHTTRILGYAEDKQPLYRFFDQEAYITMISMITLGVGLRFSSLVPDSFIEIFYSGLGLSLIIAGLDFFLQFSRYNHSLENNPSREGEII